MAVPSYLYRDYSGSAVPSGLAAAMGPGDLTFTLLNASSWINLNNHDLGTGSTGVPGGPGSGPFVVAVDYGTPNEEKILCSRANTSSNVVTVWQSGSSNGRGYDGTSTISHSANAVCVPVFSATEADEANNAVYTTIGQITAIGQQLVASGANSMVAVNPGTSGQVWTANGTSAEPTWQTITFPPGITGNPAGKMVNTSQTVIGAHSGTIIGNMSGTATGAYLKGSVTCSSNALFVPTAGVYQVSAIASFQSSGGPITAGNIDINIWKNGSFYVGNYEYAVGSNSYPMVVLSTELLCAANDYLQLYIFNDTSQAVGTLPGVNTCLSTHLVSI